MRHSQRASLTKTRNRKWRHKAKQTMASLPTRGENHGCASGTLHRRSIGQSVSRSIKLNWLMMTMKNFTLMYIYNLYIHKGILFYQVNLENKKTDWLTDWLILTQKESRTIITTVRLMFMNELLIIEYKCLYFDPSKSFSEKLLIHTQNDEDTRGNPPLRLHSGLVFDHPDEGKLRYRIHAEHVVEQLLQVPFVLLPELKVRTDGIGI